MANKTNIEKIRDIKTRKKNKKQPKKSFVHYSTIWNAVGGGFSNPGEAKITKIGKYKILVQRGEKLDRYGNPVHTATIINNDGSSGASYKSNGSLTLTVSNLLKKQGVDTRR